MIANVDRFVTRQEPDRRPPDFVATGHRKKSSYKKQHERELETKE